jgi:toxin CptA
MLRVTLRSSRSIAAVLTSAHALAALTVLPLDVALWIQLALAVAVGISLTRALWRFAFLRSRYAFLAVEFLCDGKVSALTRDGEWRDALLLHSTYVSPLLTVLNVRVPGRRFVWHVLLVPDNCDLEAFRRIRVWLRWGYGRTAVKPAPKEGASRLLSF